MGKKEYSLIIIGAGPAGLTASIYASRYGINHIVIGESLGGIIFEAYKVCNFPTEKEASGKDVALKMLEHVKSFKTPVLNDKAVKIIKQNGKFKVITTQDKDKYSADAILLATGNKRRKLNLINEDEYLGRGLSYCATCDAMFYRDKTAAVVGGSDSANTASLYLSEIAKKVYQIYRRDKLRGDSIWIEKVKKNNKIEIIYKNEVVNLGGKEKIEKIFLKNKYKNKKEIAVDGVFVEIGTLPQNDLAKQLSLDLDEKGYIKTCEENRTSLDKVWAAGDITTASNNFHQVITACSEGAIAAESIFKSLQM